MPRCGSSGYSWAPTPWRNPPESNALRTQSRSGAPRALEGVRRAATRDRKQRFTALLHHVYDIQKWLRAGVLEEGKRTVSGKGFGLELHPNKTRLIRFGRSAGRDGGPKGHVAYYGVPMNGATIGAFRVAIGRLWWQTPSRRSQTAPVTWQRMQPLIARRLPPAHICHPYPLARFAVTTQGKSRMR